MNGVRVAVIAVFLLGQRPRAARAEETDAGFAPQVKDRAHVARVTFVPPTPFPDDLGVTFDDRPIPLPFLEKKFSVDPGPHVVRAEAVVHGFNVSFEKTIDAPENELTTIELVFEEPHCNTCADITCLRAAKSQEDAQKCAGLLPAAPVVAPDKHGACACDLGQRTDSSSAIVAAIGVIALAFRRRSTGTRTCYSSREG